MNLRDVFKLAVLSFVVSCSSKKITIIPLSPYYSFDINESVKHHNYYFAIKNFSKNNHAKNQLDSFAKKSLPKKYLNENEAVSLIFYKYSKDNLDERFVHNDSVNSLNIGMRGEDLVCSYYWLYGKFMYVTFYNKNKSYLEKRNW